MATFQISYFDFFKTKLRRTLIKLSEAKLAARDVVLFVRTNDDIGSHVQAGIAYEEPVLKIISSIARSSISKEAIALDVGSNIGNHSLRLSKLFDRVYAFEPNISTFYAQLANLAYNNIHNVFLYNLGLSDKKQRAEIYTPDAENIGTARFHTDGHCYPDDQETPRTAPALLIEGDAFIAKKGIPEELIQFIKIDVEGMELKVLKGLEGCLASRKPIICFEALTESSATDIIRYLRSLGYTHFSSIASTMLKAGKLPHFYDLLKAKKVYYLKNYDMHLGTCYRMIFASIKDLVSAT